MPEFGSEDGDYLDMVSDVLAPGRTSRLYKRLVYDDQIATDVAAYVNPREIGGQFVIQATARPGVDLARVEKAIDEEMARFLAEGPTRAGSAAGAHPVPRQLRPRRGPHRRVRRQVRRAGHEPGLSGRRRPPTRSSWRREREATPAKLQAAAKRWLSDGEYVAEVFPFGDPQASTTAGTATQPPATGQPPELRLPKLERATLSNGLKVVLAERHEIPLVNFSLLVDSGYAADQCRWARATARPGAAALVSKLLDQGTKTRTSLEIGEQLAQLGANLNVGANMDGIDARLSALKTNLDASLEIFADVALNPSFPQADFLREQKQQLAAIEREKTEPVAMALRVLPGLIYGKGHAYSEPWTGSGTAASVSQLTREDMARFHAAWFKPNHATLIVVGDTTLAEMRPKLEKLFAAWKPGETPKKNVATVPLPERSVVYLVDRPGSQQSLILAGNVAPPRNNPAEVSIETMNNILGGDFGARINMNLREDKHWAYGALTMLVSARGQRPFLAYAPVQTDKTKESMTEIDKELRGILADHPATDAELARVKASETLRLPGSRETIDQRAGLGRGSGPVRSAGRLLPDLRRKSARADAGRHRKVRPGSGSTEPSDLGGGGRPRQDRGGHSRAGPGRSAGAESGVTPRPCYSRNSLPKMAQTRSLPRICIALGLPDVPTLLDHARREAEAGETFLEFRLDFLDEPWKGADAIRGFLEQFPDSIVLATCRRHQNHGRFNGSVEEQFAVLDRAVDNGALAVDLEIETAEVAPGAAAPVSRARACDRFLPQLRIHAAHGHHREPGHAGAGRRLQGGDHGAQAFRQHARAGGRQGAAQASAGGAGHGRTGVSHARAFAGVRRRLHLRRAHVRRRDGGRAGQRAAPAPSVPRREAREGRQDLRRDRRPDPAFAFRRPCTTARFNRGAWTRCTCRSWFRPPTCAISSPWPPSCRWRASASPFRTSRRSSATWTWWIRWRGASARSTRCGARPASGAAPTPTPRASPARWPGCCVWGNRPS